MRGVTKANETAAVPAVPGMRRPARIPWPSLATLAIELALIAAYIGLAALPNPRQLREVWLITAILVSVARPASGLVVLAAVAPFNELVPVHRQLGSKAVLAAALLLRVAIGHISRVARDHLGSEQRGLDRAGARGGMDGLVARVRGMDLRRVSVALAIVLLVGTAAGVLNSLLRYGGEFGGLAFRLWLEGAGAAFAVLLVAYHVSRQGDVRPLAAAIAGASGAAVLGLIDFADALPLRASPLGPLLRRAVTKDRLEGVLSAPNAVAMIVLVPAIVLLAAALCHRGVRSRITAGLASAALFAAVVLTFSRSALVATAAMAVSYLWRFSRRLAIAGLIAAIVLVIVFLPRYLAARADRPREGADLLTRGDRGRVNGWYAATRMWWDQPLTGHGYQSFRVLHKRYGAKFIRSPHNEWLRFFAEEGTLVGLAAVGFLGSTLVALWVLPGWLPLGAFGALLAFSIMASFNNPFLYVEVTVPLFVVVGTALARPPPGTGADPRRLRARSSPGA